MNDAPVRIGSTDDRLACLDRLAPTLYSLGCRITAGDHERVERLIADTVRALPVGELAYHDVLVRFARRAVVDTASRQRAGVELHLLRGVATTELNGLDVPPPSVDVRSADRELRDFDRWMDDSVLGRCRARLLSDAPVDDGARAGEHAADRRAGRRPVRTAAIAVAVAAAGVAAIGAVNVGGPATTQRPSVAALTTTDGYVIDDAPSGFAAAGAFVRSAHVAGGWLQVWAAPGASRTNGDWIALASAGPDVSGRFDLDGGRPTVVAGQPASQALGADGVEQLSVQLVDGGRVTVAGHGRPATDLAAVATEMVIGNGSFGFESASALLDAGLELVASQPSLYGTLASSAQVGPSWTSTYQSADLGRRILLSSRATIANDLAVAQLIMPANGSGESSIDVDGRPVVVSSQVGFDGKTTFTLQWHDRDNTISMSGTADLDLLIATIGRIRPATADEWRELESLPPRYDPRG